MAHRILTIGHSRHSLERFLALLATAEVTMIADVRSAPFSRFSPHFNKSALATSLAAHGIDYMFLGQALGGRPVRADLFTHGRADYEKMAASPAFRAGLANLVEAAGKSRLAAMCSEADPLDCHRCLLVGRALAKTGLDVRHVLASGEVITHVQAEDRLLQLAHLAEEDLLTGAREDRLAEAYRARARKAAYVMPTAGRR